MIIDFSQHSEQEIIRFAHVYEPGSIDLEDEAAEISGIIEVSGTARQSSQIARVEGEIKTDLAVACSRCLQPVTVKFENPFSVEFVTLENYQSSSAEHELHDADFALSVYDGAQINLGEIVREQILLELPTHQLCAENCQGLCEKCGKNKNTAACDCETEETDPRWAALQQLKTQN